MPRRASYIPLSHDDYDPALVPDPRYYGVTGLLHTPGVWPLAERLLLDGLSLRRVASRLGYACAASFCRAFKQLYGESPKQWAVKHGGSAKRTR